MGSNINGLDDNSATPINSGIISTNSRIFQTNRGIFSPSRGIWSAQLVRTFREAALAVLMLLALLGPTGAAADEPATFVGVQTCGGCHNTQFDAWKGSHHALAMQKATEATVLGDFADAKLEHFGVATTFFRDGDRFMVRTDGPDGALHDYPIAYTFGVYPLQQYLIASPGGGCRPSASPGTAGRKTRTVSAGSTSIPASNSNPGIPCIGPAATRPGTISAPIATLRI